MKVSIFVKSFLFDPAEDTLNVAYRFSGSKEIIEETVILTNFWLWLVLNDLTGNSTSAHTFSGYAADMVVIDIESFCYNYIFAEQRLMLNKFLTQTMIYNHG